MERVESLLRRTIGLDSASVGISAIERPLRSRMKTLGFKDLKAYLAHLEATPSELEELVEAVVVTETWFFRDQSPFKAFVRLAQEELLAQRAAALRILSVPCSTGEEPYSLAMALLDAGVARERFAIDAVDVSVRALERARLGLYGKNSFRGKLLEFRNRHFQAAALGYELNPDIRQCVNFHRGNLLDDRVLPDRSPYDVIFCRNLLIYFDRPTQRQALQQLHRLLAPSGVLFVGAAELPIVSENGFMPIALPMAFACRKAKANPAKSDKPVASRSVTAPKATAASTARPVQSPAVLKPVASASPAELQQARNLADAGKLAEATALCEAHLQTAGPSPQAYYLLGLVRDAAGDPTATHYYRKALYLDPNHYESLLQMALSLERKGDVEGAQKLKRRAQRLDPKT